MRSPLLRLVLLGSLFVCTACEIKAGDSDWDGHFDESIFDDDAGKITRRDARVDDEDAGTTPPKDAAVSGKDANTDANTEPEPPMDSGLPPDEPTPPEMSPADVAAALAKGRCGALEACMGKELLLDSLDGNDCVSYTTNQFADRDLHWLTKAVALGRVTFRGDLLAKCQKDIVALGCEVRSRRLPASCEDAVEGKADVDDSCSIDQECQGNMYCDKGMLATCPGQCASLQTAGLPCTSSAQCRDGLVCPAGTCETPLAEGDGCTVYLGSGECPPGLVCLGQPDNLTCRSIASVYTGKSGEACDAFGKLCQFGLVCQSQTASSGAGICGAPKPAGSTCRRSVPNQCPVEQYCKDAKAGVVSRAQPGKDGVCADLPTDGQSCDAAIGCKPGAICLGSDGKCHTYQNVGKSCLEPAQCYSRACEDDECVAPQECL